MPRMDYLPRIIVIFVCIICFITIISASRAYDTYIETYDDSINTTPLADGNMLTSYQYRLTRRTHDEFGKSTATYPFSLFPSSLFPLLSQGLTSDFSLSLTQGSWLSHEWGSSYSGTSTPGFAVENNMYDRTFLLHNTPSPPGAVLSTTTNLSAIPQTSSTGTIHEEHPNIDIVVQTHHSELNALLSSLFCAALTQIDPSQADMTRMDDHKVYSTSFLPVESVCTEHLVALNRILPLPSPLPQATTLFNSKYVSFQLNAIFHPDYQSVEEAQQSTSSSSSSSSTQPKGILDLHISLTVVHPVDDSRSPIRPTSGDHASPINNARPIHVPTPTNQQQSELWNNLTTELSELSFIYTGLSPREEVSGHFFTSSQPTDGFLTRSDKNATVDDIKQHFRLESLVEYNHNENIQRVMSDYVRLERSVGDVTSAHEGITPPGNSHRSSPSSPTRGLQSQVRHSSSLQYPHWLCAYMRLINHGDDQTSTGCNSVLLSLFDPSHDQNTVKSLSPLLLSPLLPDSIDVIISTASQAPRVNQTMLNPHFPLTIILNKSAIISQFLSLNHEVQPYGSIASIVQPTTVSPQHLSDFNVSEIATINELKSIIDTVIVHSLTFVYNTPTIVPSPMTLSSILGGSSQSLIALPSKTSSSHEISAYILQENARALARRITTDDTVTSHVTPSLLLYTLATQSLFWNIRPSNANHLSRLHTSYRKPTQKRDLAITLASATVGGPCALLRMAFPHLEFIPRMMADSLTICPQNIDHQNPRDSGTGTSSQPHPLSSTLNVDRYFSTHALERTELTLDFSYTSISSLSLSTTPQLAILQHTTVLPWHLGDIYADKITFEKNKLQISNDHVVTHLRMGVGNVYSRLPTTRSLGTIHQQHSSSSSLYCQNLAALALDMNTISIAHHRFRHNQSSHQFIDPVQHYDLFTGINAHIDRYKDCVILDISLGIDRTSPTVITVFTLLDTQTHTRHHHTTHGRSRFVVNIPVTKRLYRVHDAPPDIARGLDIPSGTTTVYTLHARRMQPESSPRSSQGNQQQQHTALALVPHTLPTRNTAVYVPFPDASMPFNATAIVATLLAFAFGSLFNILYNSDYDFIVLQRKPKVVKVLDKCKTRFSSKPITPEHQSVPSLQSEGGSQGQHEAPPSSQSQVPLQSQPTADDGHESTSDTS